MSKIEQLRRGLFSSHMIQSLTGKNGKDSSLQSLSAVDPLKAYKDQAEEKFGIVFGKFDKIIAAELEIGGKSVIGEIQRKRNNPGYELPAALADKYYNGGFSYNFSPNPSQSIRYTVHPHGNPEIAIKSGLTTTRLVVSAATDRIEYNRCQIIETTADSEGNTLAKTEISLFQPGDPVVVTKQNGILQVSATYSSPDNSGNVSLVDGGIIGGFIKGEDGKVLIRSFGGRYNAAKNTVLLDRIGVSDTVPLPDIVGVPNEVVIRHRKLVNNNLNVVRLSRKENIHRIIDSTLSKLDSLATAIS